jgi:hypothetical protein
MSAGQRVVYTRVPPWVIATLDKLAKDKAVTLGTMAKQVLVEAVTRLQADNESRER